MISEGMQIELQLNGRETVEGDTPEAVVEAMSRYQWPDDKPAGADEYMRAVSARIKTQKGETVRACCATHFLDDLAASGVIKRLS
ncbi:MAG TPA: hypothetical protein VIH18_10815 [Candidatus Binatia bacterium]